MPYKYLITGFSGFVGRHFIDYLETQQEHCLVLGVDLHYPDFASPQYQYINFNFRQINLLDKDAVDSLIYEYQPDYILHLAAYSSVAYSWKDPINSFMNNTNIFLNLVEKVRLHGVRCRILSVGSSEEYGVVNPDTLPLTEDHTLNPVSPYAVARISQEMLSDVYVRGFGLDIIKTRSFNHIGVGQKDIFVVPSFIKQLCEIKKNNLPSEINAGNIDIIRDFVDVREVVRAYYLLLNKGVTGEVYNICSGNGTSLKNVIDLISSILDIKVEIKIQAHLIRPADNPVIIGCADKIYKHVGWKSQISLKQSIVDIVESYQKM